jgi:hypothetical protein
MSVMHTVSLNKWFGDINLVVDIRPCPSDVTQNLSDLTEEFSRQVAEVFRSHQESGTSDKASSGSTESE